MDIQIRSISWQMVDKGIAILAEELQGKAIWGIPRGGQLVATMLAFHGCKLVQQPMEAEVYIDDIACTGVTLAKLQQNLMHNIRAVLVLRASCPIIPDYYAFKFDTPDYILFPWEDRADAIKLIASGRFTDQDVNTRLGKRT